MRAEILRNVASWKKSETTLSMCGSSNSILVVVTESMLDE
jgi:hypothetical protein